MVAPFASVNRGALEVCQICELWSPDVWPVRQCLHSHLFWKPKGAPTEPMIQHNFPVIHSEVPAHSGSQLFCIHEDFPKCALANFNVFQEVSNTMCHFEARWRPENGTSTRWSCQLPARQWGQSPECESAKTSQNHAKSPIINRKNNGEMLQVFLLEPLSSLVIHEWAVSVWAMASATSAPRFQDWSRDCAIFSDAKEGSPKSNSKKGSYSKLPSQASIEL